MSTRTSRYSELGADFNEKLGRRDGEHVAVFIQERLEQDLRDWFYDRIFPHFDSVPESEWNDKQRFNSEVCCRNEITFFQSFLSANIAVKCGYISQAHVPWLLDWLLRLNLGVAAALAKENRLPDFAARSEAEQIQAFALLLDSHLPETPLGLLLIRLYAPQIVVATTATIASAFGDHAAAKKAQSSYERTDQILTDAIHRYDTGGGVYFSVAKDGGLLCLNSMRYGPLLHLWSDQQAAERRCRKLGTGVVVVPFSYRELALELVELANTGTRFVHLEEGEKGEKLVQISDLLRVVKETVNEVDASEFAVAIRQAL